MLVLREGVSLVGLDPVMRPVLIIVEEVFKDKGYRTIITSGTDGAHSPASLHYYGKALDFRTKHIKPDHLAPAVALITNLLGICYDVILEEDHLHVEYDPSPAKLYKIMRRNIDG